MKYVLALVALAALAAAPAYADRNPAGWPCRAFVNCNALAVPDPPKPNPLAWVPTASAYAQPMPWSVPTPPEKPVELKGEYLRRTFDCMVGQTCVVRYNEGGSRTAFAEAAYEAVLTKTEFVFDGECWSMCTSVADATNRHACVTRRAVFRYHKGIELEVVAGKKDVYTFAGYFDLPQRHDVREWVMAHGGYPGVQDGKNVRLDKAFTTMRYPETLKFWRECPQSQPAKAPALPRVQPINWTPGIPAHGLY